MRLVRDAVLQTQPYIRLFSIFLGLFICLSGCATPPLSPECEPVVELMSQRLSLARDIAWSKWASGLQVRDPVREAGLVERVTAQAIAAGLNEHAAGRFLQAQIEASCLEQEACMNKWREGEMLPPGDPSDLGELRARINRISSLLIAEWAAVERVAISPIAVKKRLIENGFDPRAAGIAAAGFKQ